MGREKKVANDQVPETLSNEVLEKMYALDAKKPFEHIPIIENPADLVEYDAIIFGTGTRFGSMTAQMKAFIDRMGQLWVGNKLRGKIASFFTSSASQPGAQVLALRSLLPSLFSDRHGHPRRRPPCSPCSSPSSIWGAP